MAELVIGGQTMLYDEVDQSIVDSYKWHISDMGYAVWRGLMDGKKTTVRLHRLINKTTEGMVTDHINHNRLDNRRSNLRTVTQAENMRNLKNSAKGYWFHKKNSNWVVELDGKYVAVFSTEAEAKEVVKLLRNGGTYTKPIAPQKTMCIHSHSLEDAYVYGKTVICKVCVADRQRERFKRTYVPKPRVPVTHCSRGHEKALYKTSNGDCRLCAIIRAQERWQRVRIV